MSEQLRDELTNVLVMTKLSDFAGTDMKIIDAAIQALLPVVERRLEATRQGAYKRGYLDGYLAGVKEEKQRIITMTMEETK